MKVLLATPFKTRTGGIVKWAHHLINYHNSISSNIILTTLAMDDPSGNNVRLKNGITSRIRYGLRTYSKVIKDFRNISKSNTFDVLHIATSASISLLKDICLVNIAKRRGIKTVVHFHFGRIPEVASKNNWEWKLLSKVIKLANSAVVIDMASYDTLKTKGYGNIHLLPNPLAPSVEDIIAKCDNLERTNAVVFVGHCVKTKGVYELVQACKEIEGVKLSLIGPIADEVKNDLLEITDSKPWLKIRGKQSFEEVIKEMSLCGVFVLPTYTEGFPNVIIESMACGCPIITTPVGAIPEMLNIESDEPCGVCVPVKNITLLTENINLLLNTPSLAKNYGERAKIRVKKEYSMEVIWDKLVNIWETC